MGRIAHETVARLVRHASSRPDQRALYEATGELAGRYMHCRRTLAFAEAQVWSQNGEDGVLAEIFDRIGEGERFFVEFGVESGVECNSRYLAESLGWSGIYFEPDPAGHAALAARYANRADIHTACEFVTPDTATEVFAAAGVPLEPDLLSIDIDGQDYWVWKSLDAYRPRVVLIEYNSSLVMTDRLVEPRGISRGFTGTDNFGASRGAMEALAEQKGYRLVHAETSGTNLFFVRAEFAGLFPEPVPGRSPNYLLAGLAHRHEFGNFIEV